MPTATPGRSLDSAGRAALTRLADNTGVVGALKSAARLEITWCGGILSLAEDHPRWLHLVVVRGAGDHLHQGFEHHVAERLFRGNQRDLHGVASAAADREH